MIFNNQNHETNSTDKKVDHGSFEVKEKEVPEKSNDFEDHASPDQWKKDGMELKARVKCFSTKKVYKYHFESVEVDFLDSDSDGSIDANP